MPVYGSLLYPGDMFGSDYFLGVRILRADSEESMKAAVKKAFTLDEPVIINAIIDPEDYKWLVVRQKI